MWNNGYVKSYFAEYARDAGMGSGLTVDKFNYIWKDDEILNVISSDHRIKKEGINDKNTFKTYADYIKYYIDQDIVASTLPPLYIALIVIGAVVFAAIVAVVVVEILVRKGKLPKLAAKREAKKQKRLAKKAAKNGTVPKTDGDEEPESMAEIVNSDGVQVEKGASETDYDEQ